WPRRSRACSPRPRTARRCGERRRATTPAPSSTPPTPTCCGWLAAARDGPAPERRAQQQAAGDEDVLLRLAAVVVDGDRELGDLAAVVPGGQQREGADVVDAGRDAAPVALAGGLQPGALPAAAHVAGRDAA